MGGILLKKHFRAQSKNSTFEKKNVTMIFDQYFIMNTVLSFKR